MGFHGILWWFNEIEWDLMEFYGVSLDLIRFNGGFMGFYGIL